MSSILFSHSYFLRLDPKQWKIGRPYPPIGTLYAAALMRQHGYLVDFYDTMFARSPDELAASLESVRPEFFVLFDDGFNYLTKMCLTNMREAAFRMIGLAKSRGCTVVVSSSDSTDHYEEYLRRGADFILLGEGELTLLELIGGLEQGKNDMASICGLAYLANDKPVVSSRRNVLRDLDSLPFPAWDLVDLLPYRHSWEKNVGYFSINLATTRGCPFKCNWCAKPIYGNRYNSRSPENVVAEIKWLKSLHGFDHIWFCDDIFGLKPGWVRAFADLIQREGLLLRYKIQCRADLLLQEDYVADLARSGCENIWMGAESGSQKILDAMDKGTTVEQIYEATRLLKKYGIRPAFFIQFGYLGETREDIDKTIRMINELLPAEIGISVSYPLPGTVFYQRVKDDLQKKANWTDSNDLALMFRNTYQPAFYRRLHQYVHHSYRRQLALEYLADSRFRISLVSIRKILSAAFYGLKSYFSKLELQRLEKHPA
ncbi:MAG TPA: radical SAM protein [Puia sp.]|nr:radical SAM protein [Puia sp.]